MVDSDEGKIIKKQLAKEIADWSAWEEFGSPLHRLDAPIRSKWTSALIQLELLENSMIPILKQAHGTTGNDVDVSFCNDHSLIAAGLMWTSLHSMPSLCPLTILLKSILASRALHEPYSGSNGSFTLQFVTIGFSNIENAALEIIESTYRTMVAISLEFLDIYGLDFNYITTAISIFDDGFFFPIGAEDKRQVFRNKNRLSLLAIQDSSNPIHLSGKASFRIVQRTSEISHQQLWMSCVTPSGKTCSCMLGTILPISDDLRDQIRPHHLLPKIL